MYAGYCIGTSTEQQDDTLLSLLDERAYFGYCLCSDGCTTERFIAMQTHQMIH